MQRMGRIGESYLTPQLSDAANALSAGFQERMWAACKLEWLATTWSRPLSPSESLPLSNLNLRLSRNSAEELHPSPQERIHSATPLLRLFHDSVSCRGASVTEYEVASRVTVVSDALYARLAASSMTGREGEAMLTLTYASEFNHLEVCISHRQQTEYQPIYRSKSYTSVALKSFDPLQDVFGIKVSNEILLCFRVWDDIQFQTPFFPISTLVAFLRYMSSASAFKNED